jgi:hypothetical protein
MADGRRARAGQFAERVNAAVELVGSGVQAAEAARVLARRFGTSVRQARRYVDRAAAGGPMAVVEPTVVFTVKLPVGLAERVRGRARGSGHTISAVVARALEQLLVQELVSRGRGERSRR